MKQYRLRSSTIAVLAIDGRNMIATIPTGSLVSVEQDVRDAQGNQEVHVQVGDRNGMMFAIDVRDRGEEVR